MRDLTVTTAACMSSREIAELVGSRHDDTRRSIERLAIDQYNKDGSIKRRAVIQLPPMAEVKNHLGQSVSEYIFSGARWRTASYARDRYLTEHQSEITPHGQEPFIKYTPVLLRKGAVRLHELYLAGELPMKKSWNGQFTHDKESLGVAV